MHCQLAKIIKVEKTPDFLGYYLWVTDGVSVHNGHNVIMTAYYDHKRDKQIAVIEDSVQLLPITREVDLFFDFDSWKRKRGEPAPQEESFGGESKTDDANS